MDEEFIFQVTEEELAQFPEEGNQTEEEQNPQENKQGSEPREEIPQESTEKQDKGNSKVNIPSLLNLKLPKLYAASRNGKCSRWNKGQRVPKGTRMCRRWRRKCRPRDNPPIPIIPEREDNEPRDEYAFRVMQAVSQHQIESFNQMVQSMKDISTEVKKKKNEWGETDNEEDNLDNLNYQDALERPRIQRIRKRIQAPIFKGTIEECPEPHLLRAVDWFHCQGIRRDIDKVYNFKHTLDGEAREWYADYNRQQDTIPPWKTLINDFSRYYSSQGRGEKNLHEAWRSMSFTPATDDIEIFPRDLQECAKQLNYDNQAIITTIRAAMPQEVYGALYKMDDLSEIIGFCKNYYAKSPTERLKAQAAGKLEASPFKKIEEESPPPDINATLTRLTESLNKMDFTQKPYKPTLYPSGRGRGRRQRRKVSRKMVPRKPTILLSTPLRKRSWRFQRKTQRWKV